MWWIGILVVLLGVVGWWFARRPRKQDKIVSVVMLRQTLRKLTEAEVRQGIRRASGRADVDAKAMPVELPGLAAAFGVFLGEVPAFMVICVDRPYGDDPEQESRSFEDERARKAYAEHRAWIAVDLATKMPDGNTEREVLRLLGRLAAEFLDEGCTLVYAPALGRFALPGPETEATLKGDDPMSIFGDEDVNTPMINVESDDQRVEKAIAEAQRRWPQFVEAWKRSGKACKGLAKGRFAVQGVEGVQNEYIWMEVEDVVGDSVTGTIANRPVHLPGLKKGQQVTIPAANVVDWAYSDGKKTEGFFVERVIRGK